jgi:hypothetical protein
MPTQELIRFLNLTDTLARIALLGTTGTTGCQLVGVVQTQLPTIGALDHLGSVAQVDLEQRCSAIQRILTGFGGATARWRLGAPVTLMHALLLGLAKTGLSRPARQ